jgi:hypothetical protein
MIAIIKLIAAAGLALAILSPGFAPRADTCECKAKGLSGLHQAKLIPHAEDCECKAKKTQF